MDYCKVVYTAYVEKVGLTLTNNATIVQPMQN